LISLISSRYSAAVVLLSLDNSPGPMLAMPVLHVDAARAHDDAFIRRWNDDEYGHAAATAAGALGGQRGARSGDMLKLERQRMVRIASCRMLVSLWRCFRATVR